MTEAAGTAGKRTQDPVPALQLVGVFAAAEVVDEVAQLVHVLHALRHDHLLVDQVGLRQVSAGLGSTNTTNNKSYQDTTGGVKHASFRVLRYGGPKLPK